MKKVVSIYFIVFASLLFVSCGSKESESSSKGERNVLESKPLIYLQPLGSFTKSNLELVEFSIIKNYGFEVKVLPTVSLSSSLKGPSGTRYHADSILKKFYDPKKWKLVLTEQDIVHKKEKIKEWGIVGLGGTKLKIAVISINRLLREGNFAKLDQKSPKFRKRLTIATLHELGHNFGLQHCTNQKNPYCFMHAAEGKASTLDRLESKFCEICREKVGYSFNGK